jgi:hypothetical protein
MSAIIYDAQGKIAKCKDESIAFYCGPELTEAAINILQIYFGIISPQDALINNISKCHYCKKDKND